MPQPRKYKTAAERQSAYRERKRKSDAQMRRELERLKPAKAKRTTGDDLRPKLRELVKEMVKRRKKAKGQRPELRELLDYIESELVRLMRLA